MTQKNPPGYPLPDGELGEDEIVCQLVYLPNRPEYWQALLGAIHYMSTWLAWERDSGKRGKDAATNWREAFELTMGCWRMTCLEDLTTTVTDILELLQNKKDCCDDNITYLPVDPIETDIIPFDGDPPATYGETEVADWDEWGQYLCFSAHKYVDYLAHAGNSMLEATRNSAIAIGVIAAILGLLAFSGIGLPIAFGLAAAVVSGLILGGTILTFEDTEDDIEAARDEIVCAILSNRSLAAAVEFALGSNAAWDLFFQFIQYDDAIAVMYDGGYEEEYLEAVQKPDCECLCLHLRSTIAENTMIYQSSAGAQFNMVRHSRFGFTDLLFGNFNFNVVAGEGYCGPFKIIDSISISDGLNMTQIIIRDEEGEIIEQWGPDEPQNCNYPISTLVGKSCQQFGIQRTAPAEDGCGAGDVVVTMTYHDDV